MLASTYYVFEGGILRVRCGPLRWSIPLDHIHRVEPSRNSRSSPALSLDRLRIDYGCGKFVLVSPEDKEGFLREINARRSNKSLERGRDR
ncbi:MAG: PH domain-containing protein [Bryobacterales bacterium]|nr:PH domain-containing protein [Bryobacterales bacterium]